ncbi:MAG: hypothetical protein FJ303_19475 [Planctomycetes bacterium]|nr:hypothetical protein [Planctomycetota bacterium]
MHWKPEHAEILTECRRRMIALETAEPEWWEQADWLEQVEHGPTFSIPEWFGTNADYMRMRYLRALADLEAAGLLIRFCRYGRKLTHVELTAEGMKAAAEMERETATLAK